jgi:hypothetical protein
VVPTSYYGGFEQMIPGQKKERVWNDPVETEPFNKRPIIFVIVGFFGSSYIFLYIERLETLITF